MNKHLPFQLSVLLFAFTLNANAEPRVFDKSTWIELASQTCMREAPQNEAVATMRLSSSQIRYSCRCVAKDMLEILPIEERMRLIQQMQARRNLQQAGQQMLRNPKIKSSIAECSAASYLWG